MLFGDDYRIIGAMFENLRISGLTQEIARWGAVGLVTLRECVLAFWAVAFSRLLCAEYLKESSLGREN